MKFELKLQNFRCHQNAKFAFDEGHTILDGASGRGKSTILAAISFALFGNEKKVVSFDAPKDCATVTLNVNNLQIVRKSRPRSIEVAILDQNNVANSHFCSGDEAQSVIDNRICNQFVFYAIVYQKQKGLNSFVNATPAARTKFIMDLLDQTSIDIDAIMKNVGSMALITARNLNNVKAVLQASPSTLPDDYDTTYDRSLIPADFDLQAKSDRLREVGRVSRELLLHGSPQNQIADYEGQLEELSGAHARINELSIELKTYDNYAKLLDAKRQKRRALKQHAAKVDAASADAFESIAARDAVELALQLKELGFDKAEFDRLSVLAATEFTVDCSRCNVETILCCHDHNVKIVKDIKFADALTDSEVATLSNALRWNAAQVLRNTVCENCGKETGVHVDEEHVDEYTLEILKKRDNDVFTRRCPYDGSRITTCAHPLEMLPEPAAGTMTRDDVASLKRLEKSATVFETISAKIDANVVNVDVDMNMSRDEYNKKRDALATLEYLKSVNPVDPAVSATIKLFKDLVVVDYSKDSHERLARDYATLCAAQLRKTEIESRLASENESLAKANALLKSIEIESVGDIERVTKNLEEELEAYKRLAEFTRVKKLLKSELKLHSESVVYDTAKAIVKKAKAIYFKRFVDNINNHLSAFIDTFFVESNVTVSVSVVSESTGHACTSLDITLDGYETTFTSLSGGEQDRVSLAITLAFCSVIKVPFLLLDEVTSSLDQTTVEIVMRAVRDQFEGSVIVVAHQVIRGVYDNIVDLN